MSPTIPRGALALAGVALGLTLGHAGAARDRAADRDARPAAVTFTKPAPATKPSRPVDRRPPAERAAIAAARVLTSAGIASGVAIGKLNRRSVMTAGDLAGVPGSEPARRLAFVAGALRLRPDQLKQPAQRKLLNAALRPDNDAIEVLDRQFLSGRFAGNGSPLRTATDVIESGADAAALDSQEVEAVTGEDRSAVHVVMLLRSIAGGCFFDADGRDAALLVLNGIKVANVTAAGGQGTAGAAFDPSITFSLRADRGEATFAAALVGRREDAFVAAIVTSQPQGRAERRAMTRAWRAIAEELNPAVSTTPQLPARCRQGAQ